MNDETFTFRSSILGNERSLWVRAPREPTSNTGLLIVLDAELYRNRVGAPAIIEDLIQREIIEHCHPDDISDRRR